MSSGAGKSRSLSGDGKRSGDGTSRSSSSSSSQKLWFSIGDTVTVRGSRAVVRFIGEVKLQRRETQGIYVGVAFDAPVGKNDGTIDGVSYFKCPQRHGLFVRPRLVEPVTKVVTAQVGADMSNVKNALPTLTSPQDAKVVCEAFTQWNALDQLEEQRALTTSKDINLMDQQMGRLVSDDESLSSPAFSRSVSPPAYVRQASSVLSSGTVDTQRASISGKRSSFVTFDSIYSEPVPEDYKGPRFTETPDVHFAQALLEHYREHVDERLPRGLVARLLSLMEQHLLETIPGAILYFDIPKRPETQLVIVGDVHGQLNDVLWLFFKFGIPTAARTFLFNGDIADRGRYAVEIFLILFAFKLAEPTSVLINRGNHESANMNEIYGFADEVRQKYGPVIYQKFQDIFNLLPLCIIVERRVLVVHGGLFREDGVTLEMINNINRRRQCPSAPTSKDDELMFDLLWSDPCETPGRGPSGRGVDCIAFGPDVTEEFLRLNNLDVCIRSHQVPPTLRGFDPGHDGRCITLFSASNYCGTSGNFGGVIIFDPNLMFEIQEYIAPQLHEVRDVYNQTKHITAKVARTTGALTEQQHIIAQVESRAKERTRRASVLNMERDVLQKMASIICERKTDIWEALWDKDSTKEGTLALPDFKTCLTQVLSHAIPVELLLQRLNALKSDNTVNYTEFLERFRVEFRPKEAQHGNWRFETIQQVFESIMKADLTLKETLMVFDRNCDGTVSYREFHELLSDLNLGLSEPQIRLLMRIITAHYVATNHSVSQRAMGDMIRVDVVEFLGRFKVIYGQTIKDRDQNAAPWITQALEAIGRHILADKAETAERHYNNMSENLLEGLGGTTLLTAGEPPLKASRRRSSTLRSVALLQKFKDFTNKNSDISSLETNDNAGFLSYKGFINAIRKLPVAAIEAELKFKLDDDKLIRLAQAIDVTQSGRINYLEFLNAFYVVDNNTTTQVAEQLWQQICASFYQQKVTLRRALSLLDPDSSGKVDADEFRNVLTTLNMVLGPREAPLTTEQIDLIISSIESDNDNLVDYNSFLDSFVVVDVWSNPVDGGSTRNSMEDVGGPSLSSNDKSIDQDDVQMGIANDERQRRLSVKLPGAAPHNTDEDTGLLLEYLRQSRSSSSEEPVLLPENDSVQKRRGQM